MKNEFSEKVSKLEEVIKNANIPEDKKLAFRVMIMFGYAQAYCEKLEKDMNYRRKE